MLGCCFHLVPNKIIKYIQLMGYIHSCLERAVDHHHFCTRIHIAVPAVDAQPLMASYICYWDGNIKGPHKVYRGQHFSLWLISQMSSSCISEECQSHTRQSESNLDTRTSQYLFESARKCTVCDRWS